MRKSPCSVLSRNIDSITTVSSRKVSSASFFRSFMVRAHSLTRPIESGLSFILKHRVSIRSPQLCKHKFYAARITWRERLTPELTRAERRHSTFDARKHHESQA